MPVEGVKLRLVTTLLLVLPLIAVIFFTPGIYGVLVIGLLALAGAAEWAGFFPQVTTARRIGLVAAIGIGMALTWFAGPAAVMPVLVFALGWWLIAFVWVLRFPTPVPSWLILLGSLLVLVPGWLALAVLHTQRGPQWLMFFFIVIAVADSGAYFVGRAIGKVKLAPKVSPGKTWEGAAGGLVGVCLVSGLGAAWFGVPAVFLISLSVSVGLVSIVGDLTISMFKRNAGLKDSGTLFPGHGGVLDRIDSISAGAPLFVIGLGWLHRIT